MFLCGVKMESWQQLSSMFGVRPVVSREIEGSLPLRVERYFCHARKRRGNGLPQMLLLTHLGGARASWASRHREAANFLPGFSVLVPPHCAAEWVQDGAVDCAVFHYLDGDHPHVQRLRRLMGDGAVAYPFHDPLVSAAARQVCHELRSGDQGSLAYAQRLSGIMVEQTERVLAGCAGRLPSPDRVQLARLSALLDWIQGNLGAAIDNDVLAGRMGVSQSHFRRLFFEAMGLSPSRYVRQRRLERARELLATTNLPIDGVAFECGFRDQSYLTTCFRLEFGLTPARFRRAA